MPDISMCDNHNCPSKKLCYRYMAIPDEIRQSYFVELNFKKSTGKCDYFWSIEGRRIRNED